MLFRNGRESENVEDRRGEGSGGGFPIGGRRIGIGTIVLALAAAYFGVDPRIVIGLLSGGAPSVSAPSASAQRPPADDPRAKFVSMVLADTEDTWSQIFQNMGRRYETPRLVLFSGATRTGCGAGDARMGPFYCPADHKVYIDLSFYDDLRNRFGAPGDFAQAYVIAHEIGHHVQNLLGISDQIHAAQQRANEAQANQLSVRLELQADCLAGVWANHANAARQVLEAGDIEEGLRAAAAIGDDRLQQQAQGYAVPESFTHGTSEQRVQWFKRGIESGDVSSCDTFRRGGA